MESTLVQIAALASTGLGAACFYLAAPRQQWLPRPWPARPGRIAGGVLLLLGCLLWSGVMHPATAVFTSLTVAMILFIALPFAAALPVLLKRS